MRAGKQALAAHVAVNTLWMGKTRFDFRGFGEENDAAMMEAFYRELNEQMYWGRDDNFIPASRNRSHRLRTD